MLSILTKFNVYFFVVFGALRQVRESVVTVTATHLAIYTAVYLGRSAVALRRQRGGERRRV